MRIALRITAAVCANIILLANQLLASIPPGSSESPDYSQSPVICGHAWYPMGGDAVSQTTVPPPATYQHDIKGNLLAKPGAVMEYQNSRPHAISSATVKGQQRSYQYDAAGHVTSDSIRTFTWTSFGQLASLTYTGAPALHHLGNGIPVYEAASVTSTFQFDASGSRARQTKERLTPTGALAIEETSYLGSYERVIHQQRAELAAPLLETKTVHRHSLGGVIYTRTVAPATAPVVTLTTLIQDHLGSTDALLTGNWDGNAFASHTIERQSFAAFGERRDATTWDTLRTVAADPQHVSTLEIPRGFTGHEHLDDSGLIHMNGRIYDPEVGRFLSPDPVVQIPEYSQDFNRYTYCLNNPLNATDPSGFSWISKVFSKVGKWLKQNWRQIVVIIVVAVVTWGVGAAFSSAAAATTSGTTAFATANGLTAAGMATTGAIGGAVAGGLSAGLAGGSFGDILRGMAVGGIQGAITGGLLNGMESTSNFWVKTAHVAGHGITGGGANAAMGGKFRDGFLGSAAAAAIMWTPVRKLENIQGVGIMEKTLIRGITGGTASVIGGGKFSNGAYTASFQSLIAEIPTVSLRGEWVHPDGYDIKTTYAAHTNGILGHKAAKSLANQRGVSIYFNPSNGFMADIIESVFQKFLGFFGDPLTAGFVEELRMRTTPIHISAHSQGTVTVTNAIIFYGAVPAGSTLHLDSPAISHARAWLASRMIGGRLRYNQKWGDGANLWAITLNPIKYASGMIDIPLGFKIHINANSFERGM